MRIAITDASYKHALALATYLKHPKIELFGINPVPFKFASLYQKHYHTQLTGELEEIVQKHSFDLVIPVGNSSVETLSRINYPNAVLPPARALEIALSKTKTVRFAESLGCSVPKTFALKCAPELPYPVVVKGSWEAGKNVVFYAHNALELEYAYKQALEDPTQKNTPPLIQEYVKGVGLGFFAYYQNGELMRFYMHRRLREYPVSGGSATAAETFFHKEAFLEGKKLLDALQWNGPCMVEYKYDQETGNFKLMEINPKLWGSLELGLKAGLNFGEYLIASLKKERLTPCLYPNYPQIRFFWPYDGDILGMLERKDFSAMLSYCKGGYSTNSSTLGFRLSCLKLARSLKRPA